MLTVSSNWQLLTFGKAEKWHQKTSLSLQSHLPKPKWVVDSWASKARALNSIQLKMVRENTIVFGKCLPEILKSCGKPPANPARPSCHNISCDGRVFQLQLLLIETFPPLLVPCFDLLHCATVAELGFGSLVYDSCFLAVLSKCFWQSLCIRSQCSF